MTRATLEAAIAKAQDAKADARTRKAKQRYAAQVQRLCLLADVYDAVSKMLEKYGGYMSVDLTDPAVRAMMASDAMEGL